MLKCLADTRRGHANDPVHVGRGWASMHGCQYLSSSEKMLSPHHVFSNECHGIRVAPSVLASLVKQCSACSAEMRE